MRVRDVGEFGLIDRIARLVPASSPDVVVGIGDDVAVLRVGSSDYLLATCDIQVEHVHFRRDWITPRQLGHRVAAVNLSDVAAMGGLPAWGLVSLALPDELEVAFVEELYGGLREALEDVNGCVVGGNISRHPADILVDFTLLGRVEPESLVLRRGGRPGDWIFVTGTLGDSRAGLELLRNPSPAVSGSIREEVVSRHLGPRARTKAGRLLGLSRRVHAMADVSDGLLADLGHVCRASGVSARVRAVDVPVGAGCRQVAFAVGVDPLRWALAGGEDYELLFMADPEHADFLMQRLRVEAETECRVIGDVGDGPPEVVVTLADGEPLTGAVLEAGGWDHFGERNRPWSQSSTCEGSGQDANSKGLDHCGV